MKTVNAVDYLVIALYMALMPPNGMQAWLDAPVREAAVVYINGQRAGSVWCQIGRAHV